MHTSLSHCVSVCMCTGAQVLNWMADCSALACPLAIKVTVRCNSGAMQASPGECTAMLSRLNYGLETARNCPVYQTAHTCMYIHTYVEIGYVCMYAWHNKRRFYSTFIGNFWIINHIHLAPLAMVRLAHGLKEHDESQIESKLKPKRAAKLSFTSGGGGSAARQRFIL